MSAIHLQASKRRIVLQTRHLLLHHCEIFGGILLFLLESPLGNRPACNPSITHCVSLHRGSQWFAVILQMRASLAHLLITWEHSESFVGSGTILSSIRLPPNIFSPIDSPIPPLIHKEIILHSILVPVWLSILKAWRKPSLLTNPLKCWADCYSNMCKGCFGFESSDVARLRILSFCDEMCVYQGLLALSSDASVFQGVSVFSYPTRLPQNRAKLNLI